MIWRVSNVVLASVFWQKTARPRASAASACRACSALGVAITTPSRSPAISSSNSSTNLVPGAAEAAERLWAAVRAGRKIVVYGDFDADGVAAAAVLASSIKRFGGQVSVFLPHRDPEGYGLTLAALERCRRERGG